MSYRPEPGFIDGLIVQISNTTDAIIREGACRDSTNSVDIQSSVVGPGIVVDISTNGANGLDAGAVAADSWYAVHIIDGPQVPVAGLYSLSAAAPALPAGYTHFRRVGWGRTNSSSNLIASQMFGNGRQREVWYNNPFGSRLILQNGAATAWTDLDCSTLVPPTAQQIQMTAYQDTPDAADIQVRGKGFGNTSTGHVQVSGLVTGGPLPQPCFYLPTDANQEVQYQNTAVGGTSDFHLISYIDTV